MSLRGNFNSLDASGRCGGTCRSRSSLASLSAQCSNRGVSAIPTNGRIRARSLALALALLVVGYVAGCSNNPYPEVDSGRKVLYLPFREAPKSLDPAIAYDTAAHQITGNVYDTLLEYHYLERPYRLIPGLATRVPVAEPQPDGTVIYRFELRSDLLFEPDLCFGGTAGHPQTRAIQAADFVFELRRIADPAVNSPVLEPFSNLVGFAEFSVELGRRRKADPKFAALPVALQYEQLGGFGGAVAEGEHQLRLQVKKAYPQLLYWFAMPFTAPVPKEAVAYYNGRNGRPHFGDHPVGSGPYRLSSYEKQSRMVLEKSTTWYGQRHPEWRAPAAIYPEQGEASDAERGHLSPELSGKALPFIERIELRREKEAIPTFNKFQQGYYDVSGVIRESFDKVIKGDRLSDEMLALGMRLDKTVVASVFYIGFNMTDPQVGASGGERSRKLRQAMSLVANVKEYTEIFTNGRGVPAQSPLPPGIFGYEATYKNPFRQVDLSRAKALLAEAGYPEGLDPATKRPLHLTFDSQDTSADGRLRYQYWVNQWRKLGLDVSIEATTYNKFQEKIRVGAYQIFQWGWVADYPDAENFLFLLWSDMARSKNNGPNSANYSNARFDELFLRMKTLPDNGEKLGMIREMQQILEHERPWIELFHSEDYLLSQGWLNGVKSSGMSMPTMKYWALDSGLRRERRAAWNRPILWPALALGFCLILLIAPGVRTYLKERR